MTTRMEYADLGKTGLKVSRIGFGTWGMGGGWGPLDDQRATDAMRKAFELGINFFDTALAYGEGHSERLIGQTFARERDRIVVATKVPPRTWKWPVRPGQTAAEVFSAEWITESVHRSLTNLQTDYIDLLQLHAWDNGLLHSEEIFGTAERLMQEGKIRHFGVSVNDWDAYGGVGLAESGKAASIQIIYNIFEQRPAERLFPAALASQTGIIARVPFEEGLLTGKLTPGTVFAPNDWRRKWLTPERLLQADQRVEFLREFLDASCPTLAELALRFVRSHPAVSTVIPGMRRIEHVLDNVEAVLKGALPTATAEALKTHAFVHNWAYPWSEE